MAKKSNKQQEKPKNQEVKLTLSLDEKEKMVNISKSLGIQTTFNTDPISELTEKGSVENAV